MTDKEEEARKRGKVNRIKELIGNRSERAVSEKNIEQWLKRKRETEDGMELSKEEKEWAFQRSKKVQRSPKEKKEKEKKENSEREERRRKE